MSYAEYLMKQGEAKGEARGTLIGRVLTLQDLHGETTRNETTIAALTNEQLQKLADELRQRLPIRA